MPTKIRLQRRGKKGQAFYHIVIADGRAPRDGRFIEQIGTYNPLTKPADIILDFDKALNWLRQGATPTETVRAILSYTGVLYKNHLLEGMKKGALTQEQVDEKFQAWFTEKMAKISGAKKEHELKLKDVKKQRLADESKVNEAKANAIAKKLAAAAKKEADAAAEAAAATVQAAEEAAAASVQASDTAATEPVQTAEAAEPPADEGAPQPEEPKQE